MFSLYPAESFFVARAARQEVVGHLLREREVSRILPHAVQVEEELPDARGAAALADVVPESRSALLGDAALEERVCRAVHPRQPLLVAGRLGELIPESRCADGPVTPTEVVHVEAVR